MAEEIVTRELRFDLSQGEVGARRRTPQGGLIVDANISRVGVLHYTNPDGSTRRELRHPAEVFRKESLESFAHAPLTVDHPSGLVTPESWRKVTVGHVSGPAEKDGKFVAAELHIQDADTIKRIESGELKELSCGYQCRVDMTPGTDPVYGEHDARQTGILGNHVAIGPSGWGRAGPEVRLHLDGGASVGAPDASYLPRMAAAKKENEGAIITETPSKETPAARSDGELAGENAQLRAEVERLTKANETRTTADAQAKEQARIDAAVQARSMLVTAAAPHMDAKWSPVGKADDAIRREVLAVLEPDVKLDGETEAFVRGAFGSAMARAGRVRGGFKEMADVSSEQGRADAKKKGIPFGDDEDDDVEDARAASVAKQKDRWKGGDKKDAGKKDRGAK